MCCNEGALWWFCATALFCYRGQCPTAASGKERPPKSESLPLEGLVLRAKRYGSSSFVDDSVGPTAALKHWNARQTGSIYV
eukprot:6369603-Amphidinium_carterae.1